MRTLIIMLLFTITLYGQVNSNGLCISGKLNILIGKGSIIPAKSVTLSLNSVETAIDSSEYSIKSLTITRKYKTIITPINYNTITDSLGNFEFKGLKKGVYTLLLREESNFSGIIVPDSIIQLDNISVKNLDLIGTLECEFNNEVAVLHIKEDTPGLIVKGGIAPVIYESDQKFKKEFIVEYIILGCEVPPNECITSYNQTIFNFLDKKYGKKWRKTVRKDVVGLE